MADAYGAPETAKEAEDPSESLAAFWLEEIKCAQKDKFYKEWVERSRKIEKRYRDERSYEILNESARQKRYNILYSNIQTLQPALYSRLPKVWVERVFKDQDPIGRLSSQILERALDFTIRDFDYNQVITYSRDQYLLAGRGQMWLRYEAEMGPLLDEAGQLVMDESGQPAERVTSERVIMDYLPREDFLHNPARIASDLRWVARIAHMTREQLVKRFGQEIGNAVTLEYSGDDAKSKEESSEKTQEKYKKACVWEIWDKDSKKVYWVSKGYSGLLDSKDDFLNLKNFFPCPFPLLGVTTEMSMIPIPDFSLYQDQANELDEITSRISLLVKACRVAGIYNASKTELVRLLDEGVENELIPVDDWVSMAQANGIKGNIDFLPLTEIINTLIQLYDARERVKNEIYEITGIADIIRGATAASETATAQQIKGQFAQLRIQDRRRAMDRYIAEGIQLMGEVIAEKFDDETLAQMAGVQMLGEAAVNNFSAARKLLKSDLARNYRIDIETDSTVAFDEEREKQGRVEFMQAVTPFLERTMQVIQGTPEMAPLMNELLLFTVRGFKAGRQLESTLEQAVQTATQMAQKARKDPPPDPEAQKMQAEMQMQQAKLELEREKAMVKAELDKQKAMLDLELKKAEQALDLQKAQFDAQLEQERLRSSMALQAEKVRADIELKAMQALIPQPGSEEEKDDDMGEGGESKSLSLPPIVVNVDARQPVRKSATIERGPDGRMTGVQIADIEESAPLMGE